MRLDLVKSEMNEWKCYYVDISYIKKADKRVREPFVNCRHYKIEAIFSNDYVQIQWCKRIPLPGRSLSNISLPSNSALRHDRFKDMVYN